MSLISVTGSHRSSEKRERKFPTLPKFEYRSEGILLTERDCWLIIAVLLWIFITAGWVLTGLPEKDVPVVEPVAAVETAAPVAEVVEMVTIDQIEALAMGIDAVISSECRSEWVSDTTLVMVANVIINRTIDARFPDTVDQVLMQPHQFSCFSTTGMKWVGKAATDLTFRDRCMAAAKAAMNGERMLTFDVVYVSGVQQGAVLAQLDGLYFGS